MLLFSAPAWSQPTTNPVWRNVRALPATCNPDSGEIVHLQTGNQGLYYCQQNNVWKQFDSTEVINVKSYGAKGDGINSDTLAVTAALTAGNILYFPPGTYQLSLTVNLHNNLTILGAGRENTILRNNSLADPVLSITTSNFVSIRDLTIDNGTRGNNAIYALNSTYLQIDRLTFKNYGNGAVAGTYGLYLDGCTLSSVNDIDFFDNTLLNGGHIYVNTSYYSVFKKITAGKAGTASSAWSIRLNAASGLNFHGLYLEEGGGNGLILIQSSENMNFFGFSSEIFNTRDPSLEPAWIRIIASTNISFDGVRITQVTSTAPVIPLFKPESTEGFILSNVLIKRYVNSAVNMIVLGAGDSNIDLSNVEIINADDFATPAPVAYVFFDTGGNATTNVSFSNIRAIMGNPTYITNGITNLTLKNLQGTITNTGALNIDRTITDASWNPVPNANLTLTAGTSTMTYERHGNLVTLFVFFTVNAVGGVDLVTLSLPFTSGPGIISNTQIANSACYTNGVATGDTGLFAYIGESATDIIFFKTNNNAASVQLSNTDLAPGDDIGCTISYIAVP